MVWQRRWNEAAGYYQGIFGVAIGIFVWTIPLSMFIGVIFESPFINLQKLLFA